MRIGYSAGHDAGFAKATEIYERQIAVLREEMADLRTQLADANTRAEGAVDQLLLRMGSQAVSRTFTQNQEKAMERQEKQMQDFRDFTDPTADRPLGTPGSEFDRPNDPRADLLYGIGETDGLQ